MVHRRLTDAGPPAALTGRRRPAGGERGAAISGGLLLLAALLAALAWFAWLHPSSASAANTRISIADFQWSKDAEIDLGESVTWDFIGPDLQHSVTGQPPNATQWDSDPGQSMPIQALGSEYTVTFDEPGTYFFQCKIHTSVRGTVTVSNTPGDPASDPGPKPALNLDIEPPVLDDWFFTRDGMNPTTGVIGPKGNGIGFRFSVGERGTAEADYYRLVPKYRWKTIRKKKRIRRNGKVRVKIVKKKKRVLVKRVRRYAGYTEWETHIGWNLVRFAKRSATFPNPVAGKYVAIFRATDESANETAPITLRFEIKRGKKAGKK